MVLEANDWNRNNHNYERKNNFLNEHKRKLFNYASYLVNDKDSMIEFLNFVEYFNIVLKSTIS